MGGRHREFDVRASRLAMAGVAAVTATAAVVTVPDLGAPALVDAGAVSLAAVRTPLT